MPPGRERRLIWLPDPQQHDQDNQLQTKVLERSSQGKTRGFSRSTQLAQSQRAPGYPIALCKALANHYKVPFFERTFATKWSRCCNKAVLI